MVLLASGPVLNTNAGGDNQHQGSTNPVFSFSADLPRITFQRPNMPTSGSWLVIYQGAVTANQVPPPSPLSSTLVGSLSLVASPADFEIDFGSASAVAQQIDTLLLTAPTSTWTIAVVETNNGSHNTTDASFQFNLLGLKAVNGALVPTLKAATQLGVMNQ